MRPYGLAPECAMPRESSVPRSRARPWRHGGCPRLLCPAVAAVVLTALVAPQAAATEDPLQSARDRIDRAHVVLLVADPTLLTSATQPNVQYSWQAGDTDTPGLYIAEWVITYTALSQSETAPNDVYMTVSITRPAGPWCSSVGRTWAVVAFWVVS